MFGLGILEVAVLGIIGVAMVGALVTAVVLLSRMSKDAAD